jgi:hypothetical protein
MVLAMLLAHLVGDYIFQWDSLSRWKSERIGGVLVHGLIVFVVTLFFALLIDPSWWPWAVFIGLTHTLIDGLELPVRRRLANRETGKSALALFIADQTAHLAVIAFALIASGYLELPSIIGRVVDESYDHKVLTFILGYAFLTMPAWIIIKFVVHGLNGTPPDFSPAPRSKYMSILERGIIATLILFGQFILVPLVTIPRLIYDWPGATGGQVGDQGVVGRKNALYLAELAASVAVAVAIGLVLRQL